MNVVGKVGSLITQGVYSVATPFHPFGGAVDAIVVQQQDGTFRSTPWYVRFGKFQGVLKGAEKIVRINVNGVEANFHMYLDNSGEAYFVKEVDDDKGIQSNSVNEEALGVSINDQSRVDIVKDGSSNGNVVESCRLEHSVSDPGVVQLKENNSLDVVRIERVESDIERRFYDFQDDQSSLDGSVELSEFGSTRYDNLDGEAFVDPQGSDSEVILVSVDGHVLTAPISASEQNVENVQLSTPQFHLGPGEESAFCEGNEDFNSGKNAWADDYISNLNNVVPGGARTSSNDNNVHQMEACKKEEEHACHTEETLKNLEGEIRVQPNPEDVSDRIRRNEVFKSCLELQDLAEQGGNVSLHSSHPSLEDQNTREESSPNGPIFFNKNEYNDDAVDENEDHNDGIDKNEGCSVVQDRSIDKLTTSSITASPGCVKSPDSENEFDESKENTLEEDGMPASKSSVMNGAEGKDKEVDKSTVANDLDNALQAPAVEDDCTKSELVDDQKMTSWEGDQKHSSPRIEISLCGHELRMGMGLGAAAEAFEAHRISADAFRSTAASLIKNGNLIIKFEDRYLPWEKAAHLVLGMAAFGFELPVEHEDAIPVEQDDTIKSRDDSPGTASTPSGRRWRLWPIPFRKVKTLEHSSSNSSNEEVFVDTETTLHNLHLETTPTTSSHASPRKQLIRTNAPTNEQIASLNLKEGQNFVTFSFSTRVLGNQQVDAHIYLWKWNARIVISDVDGTITKSDVLGQVMPLVGRDWTQSGVARLFSAIKENGYQLLFLSARAIVQAYLTRSFLLNLKQDGKALPNGPVVISPDGLFPSLYREVIRRAPHEFKIACLEDIKRLFPSDYNPFYAGFGNRDTDELSYRRIGIPKGKIFIINPKGEVAISHRIDVKSYTSLHTLVNDMFPPTSMVEQEDYNSWNYWKMPLPEVDD